MATTTAITVPPPVDHHLPTPTPTAAAAAAAVETTTATRQHGCIATNTTVTAHHHHGPAAAATATATMPTTTGSGALHPRAFRYVFFSFSLLQKKLKLFYRHEWLPLPSPYSLLPVSCQSRFPSLCCLSPDDNDDVLGGIVPLSQQVCFLVILIVTKIYKNYYVGMNGYHHHHTAHCLSLTNTNTNGGGGGSGSSGNHNHSMVTWLCHNQHHGHHQPPNQLCNNLLLLPITTTMD
jgi:hypothetical protein